MSRNKELFRNTLLLGISKIATQFITFLLVPLYTFVLSPEDLGYVDLIITYLALVVPFLTIQLEFAAFRFAIAIREDDNKQVELISTILTIIIPFTVIIVVLFLVSAYFTRIPYAQLIALNVFTSVFSTVFLQFSRGIGKTKEFAIASVIAGLITVLTSGFLILLLHWKASSLLVSTAISNIISVVYLSFAIDLKSKIKFRSNNKKLRKELLDFALPLLPNNVSWWVVNVSDRTIISLVLGFTANGVYAIANKFAFIPSLVFGIFNMSWAESASLHINAKDRDIYFSNICNSALKIYSGATILLISALSIAFPYIVGNNFSKAYNYIPILTLGALAQGATGLYSAIYIAKKETKELARTSLFAATINITLNLAFVSFIGIYAASISTCIAFLAMFIYRNNDVKRHVDIKYERNLFIKIFIILLIISTLYYWNNLVGNFISISIAIASTLFLNYDLLRKYIEEIIKYKKRRKSNKARTGKNENHKIA